MASKEGPISCFDCKKDCSSSNNLNCDKHKICQDCLIKRVQTRPEDITGCSCKSKSREFNESYLFSEAVQSKPAIKDKQETPDTKKDTSQFFDGNMPEIMIFVDNSNIWIEAKKLQSRKKGFKTSEDHRVRIDVGKLADAIAGDRPAQGFLYGSEPPPVDTVWKNIKSKGWKVKTKQRSTVTGKEKEIDTQLVADITETAIKTPTHERTTIVLVSGDADVIPALEKVIQEERWKIEVYMWQQAIAKNLSRFALKHKERVEIKYLDNCLDKATFTSMRFPIASNINLKSRVKENGVVFSMEYGAFLNRIPDKAWCNRLENITQWPFQYYWFQIDKKATNDLVIVFSADRDGAKFDIAHFLATIQTRGADGQGKYRQPKVEAVKTFVKFIEEKFKHEPDEALKQFDVALEQPGVYDEEDVLAGHENDKNYVSDSEEKWSTVQSKHIRPRNRQFYSDSCPYKFNCSKGTKCRYKHTDEERQYFTQRNGRGNPLRKVEECRGYKTNTGCRKSKKECDYAHGKEDAWCLNCRSEGHFTVDCPE